MTLPHAGEIAGLLTAALWAGSALSFETAGHRIGSFQVNVLRLGVAAVFLAIQGLVFRGAAIPLDAPAEAWTWFGISGLVGFVIGDLCLFQALVVLGVRTAMLIMCLVPPMTAIVGWLVLAEGLSAFQAVGMLVTLAGIGLAIREPPADAASPPGDSGPRPAGRRGNPSSPRGLALALLGAAAQSVGLVLSKQGMASLDEPFAAAQIRVLTGLAGFLVLATILRAWPRLLAGARDRSTMGIITFGAFVGPFLGVAMSLVAVSLTPTGVASTLMATTPILLIPLTRVIHREPVTLRAVLAAVVAVGGVALLFV